MVFDIDFVVVCEIVCELFDCGYEVEIVEYYWL